MLTPLQAHLEVRRYHETDAATWNTLIDQSLNGPFLFRREFMDYHANRFEDFSYLVWQQQKLVAVFVAGRARNTNAPATLIAHPGLTYGGLVYTTEMKYGALCEVYAALLVAFKEAGFTKLLLRPVTQVFSHAWSANSLFYFHQHGFELVNRELNSVLDLGQPLRFRQHNNLRRARRAGLLIEASQDFAAFWPLLETNLWQRHKVMPAHSVADIQLLHQRFPQQVLLYVAWQEAVLVGGIVVFVDDRQGFAHTQYISASDQGKRVGAVAAILMQVLADITQRVSRLSFGISTVQGQLNAGLLAQKEEFGAVGELLDTYSKNLVD
jgi:hypothetical protein